MAENDQNQNLEQNQEDEPYIVLHMFVQLKDGTGVWLEGDALERYDRGEI